jgi:tetratricopeptide (TPR) repeat protein
LLQHDRAEEALRWLTNLPPATRAQQPVPVATTEAYIALTNWTAVQTSLADQRWAELDFMRLAFLSQASLQKRELTASTHWRSAVREAGERLGALGVLLNLADTWQRAQDKEDLLWHIYERHPGERWTLRELARLYQAEGNTRGLNKLFGVLAELGPKDFETRNNLAATSLLLKLNLTKAYELAKALYTERPDLAIIASTYAFALHLRGSTQEGLAVLQKLKPESLEDPPVALYYGVLLSASGQPAQARKYLDLAQPAKLLPEEKQLLETARKALRVAPPPTVKAHPGWAGVCPAPSRYLDVCGKACLLGGESAAEATQPGYVTTWRAARRDVAYLHCPDIVR